MQCFQTKTRRVWVRIRSVSACLLTGMLIAIAGCSRPAPESALREAVGDLQAAIESRDAAAFRGALAEDFIGNDTIDRDGARRLAALYFLRSRNVGITLGPLDVRMSGTRAEVTTTAAVTGGSGRLMPDSAAVYSVRSGWRLEGSEWQMTSLEWTNR